MKKKWDTCLKAPPIKTLGRVVHNILFASPLNIVGSMGIIVRTRRKNDKPTTNLRVRLILGPTLIMNTNIGKAGPQ